MINKIAIMLVSILALGHVSESKSATTLWSTIEGHTYAICDNQPPVMTKKITTINGPTVKMHSSEFRGKSLQSGTIEISGSDFEYTWKVTNDTAPLPQTYTMQSPAPSFIHIIDTEYPTTPITLHRLKRTKKANGNYHLDFAFRITVGDLHVCEIETHLKLAPTPTPTYNDTEPTPTQVKSKDKPKYVPKPKPQPKKSLWQRMFGGFF